MVGLVSAEERSFYWRLTGRENLQFYASLYHISRQRVNKRIDELLNLVELEDKADIRFHNYSTGMRQKLALVRAMLHDPQVLFLDEPTSAMDPHSAKLVRDAIRELRRDQHTVILCTHNLNEAEMLADRIAIIRRGRIVALGTDAELKARLLGDTMMELRLAQPLDGLLSAIDGLNVLGMPAGFTFHPVLLP